MSNPKTAPQTVNHQISPLEVFQQTFCNHCPDREYCTTNIQRKHICILTLLADEIARTRQLIQNRTRHLTWWERD